jgi:hypothetical protein
LHRALHWSPPILLIYAVNASAQATTPIVITLVQPVPQTARAGVELSPAPTVHLMRDGQNLANATVQAHIGPTGEVTAGDTAVTDANGYATLGDLVLSGPAGALKLVIQTQGAAIELPITLTAGRAARVDIMRQPSLRAASDTMFTVQPMVRVTDRWGNMVSGAPVSASVVRVSSPNPRKPGRDPALVGSTMVKTDDKGEALFSDLGISSGAGTFKVAFSTTAEGQTRTTDSSSAIAVDPDEAFNRSSVAVSAIKSISGIRPPDEFFDVRFRFRIPGSLFVFSNIDIALSNSGTDSVSSTQKRLTEGGVSLNYAFGPMRRQNGIPERTAFAGAQAKIFNTLTYYGPQFGIVELGGSAFAGSSIAVSYLHPILPESAVVDGVAVSSQEHNFYWEFYLRSSLIPFFSALTLRGGVLVPADPGLRLRVADHVSTQSRIVISVPVGTIALF